MLENLKMLKIILSTWVRSLLNIQQLLNLLLDGCRSHQIHETTARMAENMQFSLHIMLSVSLSAILPFPITDHARSFVECKYQFTWTSFTVWVPVLAIFDMVLNYRWILHLLDWGSDENSETWNSNNPQHNIINLYIYYSLKSYHANAF